MSDFSPRAQHDLHWISYQVAPTFVQRSTATGPAMSDLCAAPKTPHSRSWTAHLPLLLILSAAALSIGYMPHGSAALAMTPARSVGIEVLPAQPATSAEARSAATASGTDHSAIAADAVLTGDAETVERSVGAYER